ncbi:hypothetical protein PCANC_00541 [Puccinia coronata f. sp. avenae]|uniref:F-box domain-containing protein n=1 Tax=Puccinia coronata f. sp. avenae TaxID=200324 RepID=A0A2N5W894_9BASI|nr:hypothetical protein PCANC_00541 [Puccinia coronata f. sp. avenae]
MALISDLPAELVIRIIHHVLFYPKRKPPPDPYNRRRARSPSPDHHELNHTEIDFSVKRKPKVLDEERIIPRDDYQEPVSEPKVPRSTALVWLSGVNHTFRLCAQELLFKDVVLGNTRTARVFLKALTCVPPQEDKSPRKRQKRDQRPSRLSQHVRSLEFKWDSKGGKRSKGKTGASLFCKIIHSCPLLENISICNDFLRACKEPILEALASRPFITKFVLLNSDQERDYSAFEWPPHEVVPGLFSHWDSLKRVECFRLSGWFPCVETSSKLDPVILNCAIRTMILQDHNCGEKALSLLLKSCGDKMHTLKISGPHFNLHPQAFGRVLRDCTSRNLEVLIILQLSCWRLMLSELEWNDPANSPGILDHAFDSPTALKNLKTLSFYGRYMATDKLFARLPKSLVKLAWERCTLTAPPFIDALVNPTVSDDKGSLPNLMCCSIRTRRGLDFEDEMTVRQVLETMRGGFFHLLPHPGYGSPSSTDSDGSHPYRYDPYDNGDEA